MTLLVHHDIDWRAKLRHCLQTVAFCLVLVPIQHAFQPSQPYGPALVHSLAIGLCTWALIDGGRHFFPSARGTGWPQGAASLALPLAGMVLGYLSGMQLAGLWLGRAGWASGSAQPLRLSLLITALAGASLTYYFYSSSKNRYLAQKIAEARQHASEARLKLLQAQLEPHMLFNTLANLRALIGADPARAQQMLDHLVAYLRATLQASRSTWHPLATEFERLGDYLELMAVRMGPRLRFTLELPAELEQLPVPALLLQPLVENALRHGLEPQVAGGSIRVRACLQDGVLRLDVSDTGCGLDTGHGAALPASGFGLAQVRERLQALYGPSAQLQLGANPPHGTTATLQLPLQASLQP